jgi:23S rRNA pseudouridine955/2504/2580 synthase
VFRSHKPKGSFGSQRANESNFEPRRADHHVPAETRQAPKRQSFDGRKPRGVESRKPRDVDARKARERTFEARPPRPVQAKPTPVQPKITPELQVASGVQTVTVSADESGLRVDRYFEARFPGLSFSHIQRIVRKGEVRVNGKRVDTKDRLQVGQQVRIPPLKLNPPKRSSHLSPEDEKTRDFLKSITLHEDDDVLVLNKPMGLSVQGGSGTTRHVDGMLEVLRQPGVDGQRPRLVHRLDKDTAGCLLVAKTRFAATALAKTFRTRSARKTYWALTAGVPKPRQGRISTYLAKEEREEESFMRVAQHGEEGASHAVTYYAVVETSAQTLAWVSLKPVTGRTHQLRAHMAHIGYPIVGDPKYFQIENWELPGGLQNRLHLLARRIVVPHPRGGEIDVTAPLPPHMQQSWNLLGLDATRYDPIVDAPEED